MEEFNNIEWTRTLRMMLKVRSNVQAPRQITQHGGYFQPLLHLKQQQDEDQ
jgi:hypothetical protein